MTRQAQPSHTRSGRYRQNFFDLVRELMRGPKTLAELVERVEMCENAIRDWMIVARNCGVVMVERVVSSHGRAYRYHWCPVPFERPDTMPKEPVRAFAAPAAAGKEATHA